MDCSSSQTICKGENTPSGGCKSDKDCDDGLKCDKKICVSKCCANNQPDFTCTKPNNEDVQTLYKIPSSKSDVSSTHSSLPNAKQKSDLHTASGTTIPTNWSWRPTSSKNNKISSVKSQGGCGDCWAVAATTALSDRFAIKYKMKNPELSYLYTVSCIGPDYGIPSKCQCSYGGNLQNASCGFSKKGARLDSCYPSLINLPMSDLTIIPPLCPANNCCDKDFSFKIDPDSSHLMHSGDVISISSVPNIQTEINTWNMIKRDIFSNGPIPATIIEWTSSLNVFWDENRGVDFVPSKIYNPYNDRNSIDSKKNPSGHAMVIVGWGSENGVDYWEVRNSWGTYGPGGGYFKYKMIHNDPCCLVIPRLLHSTTLAGGSWRFVPGALPDGYKKEAGIGNDHEEGSGEGGKDEEGDNGIISSGFFQIIKKDGSVDWIKIGIAVCALIIIIFLVSLMF